MATKRVKRYIDTNVLDEAKKRIHHVIDIFDSLSVNFSGGKDSLVVMHLVKEVYEERGITDPVNVLFYDEEVVPSTVIDFVDHYRQQDWVNMVWLAVPLRSEKYLLGETSTYIQWDPTRKHVRPKPPWALTQADLGINENSVLVQSSIDTFVGTLYPGRVAVLNGIRASESPVRYQASVAKLVENYINAGATRKTAFVKPIFDWEQNDVFRYFYDRGIRYCPVYDFQTFARQGLRVSTPLHAENAKRFHKLREVDPVFYEQVMEVFPEMAIQERYGNSLLSNDGKNALIEKYGQDWEGLFRLIAERFPDRSQAAKARVRVRRARKAAETKPHAYPPEHVARQLLNGAIKRNIMPASRAEQRIIERRRAERAERLAQ